MRRLASGTTGRSRSDPAIRRSTSVDELTHWWLCSKQNMRIRFSPDIALNSPPPSSRIRGCAHSWADLHRRPAQKECGGIEYGGLPVNVAVFIG
jgi:hypothetical protein